MRMAESKETLEKIAEKTVAEGGLIVVLYFDMHDKQKDNLKGLVVDFVKQITAEPGVVYAHGEVHEPMEIDGMYSTSAEVYMVARKLGDVLRIATKYGPIGAEMLRPAHLKLSAVEVQDIILDTAQNSMNFSQYVVSKVMKEEERKDFEKQLERRAEVGRKLLEKKNQK